MTEPSESLRNAFEPKDPNFATRVRESFARQRVMETIGAHLTLVEPGLVEIEMPFLDDLTQQPVRARVVRVHAHERMLQPVPAKRIDALTRDERAIVRGVASRVETRNGGLHLN